MQLGIFLKLGIYLLLPRPFFEIFSVVMSGRPWEHASQIRIQVSNSNHFGTIII